MSATFSKESYSILDFLARVKTPKYLVYSNSFCEGFSTNIEFVDDYMEFVDDIIKDINSADDTFHDPKLNYDPKRKSIDVTIYSHEGDHNGLIGTIYAIFGIYSKEANEIYSELKKFTGDEEETIEEMYEKNKPEDWSWVNKSKKLKEKNIIPVESSKKEKYQNLKEDWSWTKKKKT